MGINVRFCNILICFCLLPIWAHASSPAPVTFKGIYVVDFAGVPFGKVGLEFEQNTHTYAITADVISTGLVNLFTKHSSHTTVESAGGKLVYETHYQTKKKKRHVKWERNNNKTIEEIVEPPDNRAVRPAVPEEQKRESHDPLSMVVQIRDKIPDVLEGLKNFSVNVYDGRRLTKVDIAAEGTRVLKISGKKIPVVALSARRSPITGFTPSEMEDFSRKEPPLYIYMSNDARAMPIRLEWNFWMGKITATLTKECRTGESCLLGIKE